MTLPIDSKNHNYQEIIQLSENKNEELTKNFFYTMIDTIDSLSEIFFNNYIPIEDSEILKKITTEKLKMKLIDEICNDETDHKKIKNIDLTIENCFYSIMPQRFHKQIKIYFDLDNKNPIRNAISLHYMNTLKEGIFFPIYFLQIYNIENPIQKNRLSKIFQENLSESGLSFLKADKIGKDFTIDYISETKREIFIQELSSLCSEFIQNSYEVPSEALTPEHKKQINKWVNFIMIQLKSGHTLSQILELSKQIRSKETDRTFYKLSQSLNERSDRLFITKKKLHLKAEINSGEKQIVQAIESFQDMLSIFDNKTEEQLIALTEKPSHEKAAEELLELVELEKKQSKHKTKSKKSQSTHLKKTKTTQIEPPITFSRESQNLKQTPSDLPLVFSHEEDFPIEELTFLNQRANQYTFLAKRVLRWGELSVEEIKNIPRYKNIKNPNVLLEKQAKHNLKGIQALIKSTKLCCIYSFPSRYLDDKGNYLSGRGLLASLHYHEKTEFGVVYIGLDEASGKIYHAFFETKDNCKNQVLNDLLRPKVYEQFQRASQETMKEQDDGYQFCSKTTFELAKDYKFALKMIQADLSGKEQLHYTFYPIRT